MTEIEKFKVDPQDFVKTSKHLLKGGSGSTSFVTQQSTGQKCVLKQTNQKLREQNENLFYRSVQIFSQCNHPTIVPFIGYCIEKNKGNIYLKAIENGSLDQYIGNPEKTKDPLWDDTHKLIISYGVACAMEYLHSHDIVDRDLKSKHVLLDSELHPILTDFDCSVKINDPFDPESTIHQTTAIIMAPEFLDDFQKYNRTKPIDVYSYSIILYEIWTGSHPYPENISMFKIIHNVMNKVRPEFPSTINSNIRDLITKCWDHDPEKRPTFTDICNILEGADFIPNIDRELFNSYKQSVRP